MSKATSSSQSSDAASSDTAAAKSRRKTASRVNKSTGTTSSRAPAASRKAAAKKATTKTTKTKAAAPKTTAQKTATKTASSSKPKRATEKKSVKSSANVPVPKSKTDAQTAKDDDDKPKIAPAPMRPALRVAKRAEARRDKNQKFKVNTQIIYPAHGVGNIVDLEKQTIGDFEVELFVIDFEHEKMKLRVPVAKAAASGMRNLSTTEQIDDALELLEGRARVKRTMWSRRAQEYEAKINSGDLVSVAEVVRDLFRADDQPEQSYSERQLFEQARERFGREVAAVRKKSLEKAIDEIHIHLDRKEKVEAK
ncbi:transcriptional regulator [Parvularcula bermudensis HTCC2503]|uniref:Transcriptional regulator n=1 Tax=Parvularcula bermudensis (strain ATCC BAA-594 / HTCC2503 / KCTC 12087) TaxID=314260 RepID=E0THB8_PARBH|nr:CarD family transcriptional regulator [Parvularcula bermudensis]ADM10208.1 transcriptional regulator [Parvularcula bermudensis HTCC2503]